ncbi:fumarate reductase/succinate dehydrogenase flavoprotein domain protein [Haloterrigena turkmenica DSM 5511]|uniref:L-aspartate oxidase n=1 Tax=Haloterrigena turkmenica (strain ATCC 51198 / DSM 5511 / JCM 9101 / NCIMB 13204 / VKM B-1734 / 4k) TaxID=543526 RepID=D2RVR3_HALTV|nr:FAD-dependent oxidoreductase [Haloterrigena turkmenica]ADB59427.1 fumarate reductase/succinate dehydrogenase flavoprotein domain protein [Haloterrigena turkmenica DSM 5511]
MTDTPNSTQDATPETADVLVVGSGIAGCAAALAAAREGAEVLLLTKAEKPDGASTDWAQGGISTTRGDPESLKRDILEASDGTADPDAIDVLVEHADDAVEDVLLETLGIEFDETSEGEFDYTREAAHSNHRILHVDAATGTHILRPFLNYVDDHDRIEVRQDTAALDLITHEGRVHGVLTDEEPDGHPVFAGTTVLATGGIGALYTRSTNPDDATGDGIAMAALAGAEVEDMEYVQFHPTAYDCEAQRASRRSGDAAERDDPFLLSEALRGEGAVLRNGHGERFMDDYHPDAELAPRDIVARAVETEREETGEVVLDVSTLEGEFAEEYPAIAEKCRDRGIEGDEIPVAPCEHFLCGGIAVDENGRTSLDRLYAVGECVRTGVHGANRLASTSLLEGLVWGLRAGEDAADSGAEPEVVEAPDLRNSDPDLPERFAAEKSVRLKRTMDEYLGLERDPEEIARASAVLRRLKGEVDAYIRTRTARDLYELRNACVVTLLIARAAGENDESVGCHYVVSDGDEATAEPESPADD